MTATTFSSLELDESLLTALEEKGYQRPTAIQADAIPARMDGRDILGSAPTGTGKTAAFCFRQFNTCLIIHVKNQARHVFLS